MTDRDLQTYYKFDEADLFANRSGVLTAKQRKRLEGDAQGAKTTFLIIGLFLFVIAILPSIILYLVHAQTTFLIIWSVVWIPVWSFIAVKVINVGKIHKTDFDVQNVEGQVNLIKVENYNTAAKRYETNYELHIGGVTFHADPGLADVLMQGDRYAIYYAGETKNILSAEKLGEGG